MAVYAYIRVSTLEQKVERQIKLIKEEFPEIIDKYIYIDKKSGKNFDRKNYLKLRKKAKKGDVIIFTELSRLSRNYYDISEEIRYYKNSGIKLKFLDMPFLNVDSDDLTQSLINDICVQIFAYVAQKEREVNAQRTKAGLRVAKAKGKRIGRPKISPDIRQKVVYYRGKNIPTKEISKSLKISLKSVYNIINEEKK